MVEDVATQMNLTGQEARILLRWHIPAHPANEQFTQLCTRYKELSVEQLQKHRDEVDKVTKTREKERKLDKEFTQRLQDLEQDSLDDELPTRRKPTN